MVSSKKAVLCLMTLIVFVGLINAQEAVIPGSELLFEFNIEEEPDDIVMAFDQEKTAYVFLLKNNKITIYKQNVNLCDGYEIVFLPGLSDLNKNITSVNELNIAGDIWEIYFVCENDIGGEDIRRVYYNYNELILDRDIVNIDYRTEKISSVEKPIHSFLGIYVRAVFSDKIIYWNSSDIGA